RAMPPPALLPISIVLLRSIGNLQKVSFIAFFCLFPVLLNTIDGVRGIDPTLVDTARSFRIPRAQRIRSIVLPAAMPQIVAGMRNSLALAVIMMVLSEYFAATSGVGYVLLISKNTFQLGPMWAAIVLIGLLGYLLNALFLLAERWALAWHRGWRVHGPPEGMALVFQEYGRSLMPWTSVRNNVLLPLRDKKLSGDQRSRLVEEAVQSVGLTRFLDHYPWQLSGGMQQRVAIARALAYQPSILLMDEPFASVDAQTRGDLEDLVLRVREEYGITILFVTHDIDESVYLADRVVVLTHSPTEVKEIVQVDLARPRDQIATKELPEF